tara:strand:- start:14716 stop:14877 length:162 start_codon:yes stop_codon:yes gene_type:complete
MEHALRKTSTMNSVKNLFIYFFNNSDCNYTITPEYQIDIEVLKWVNISREAIN